MVAQVEVVDLQIREVFGHVGLLWLRFLWRGERSEDRPKRVDHWLDEPEELAIEAGGDEGGAEAFPTDS